MFLKWNPIFNKLDKKAKQSFLAYVVKKFCPVSDKEWQEIYLEINQVLGDTKAGFAKALFMSRVTPGQTAADPALMELDVAVREAMKKGLNLDELARGLDLDPDTVRSLDQVKDLEKEFKEGR